MRYCETISEIPPYCALWGFWCLNMANLVRYPLPLSERFPLGEHAKWRCDNPPPPQKGYLSDTRAIPYECDTRLCETILKGYGAIWGVSRTGPLSLLMLLCGVGVQFICSGFLAVCGDDTGTHQGVAYALGAWASPCSPCRRAVQVLSSDAVPTVASRRGRRSHDKGPHFLERAGEPVGASGDGRPSLAIASTMHRSANWEVYGSALGSAPEGALGNRCSRGCSGGSGVP